MSMLGHDEFKRKLEQVEMLGKMWSDGKEVGFQVLPSISSCEDDYDIPGIVC